jgi:hypothetical protein
VNIDAPILRDLKKLQKAEGKSLGRLISELLAQALAQTRSAQGRPSSFKWISRPMHAKVDLTDKEALNAVLDEELRSTHGR